MDKSIYIRYDYETYESLLIVDKGLSKKEFLHRAGAKKGYSKQLFGMIYDSIFSESEDLKDSFERYYSCEYSSFTEFLRREFSLPRQIAKDFGEATESHDKVTVLRWSQLNYGDTGVADLVFSDEIYNTFKNAICSNIIKT